MEYTVERIYELVGKNDYVANITFRKDSNGYQKYGDMITIQLIYTQFEREKLDERVKQGAPYVHGKIKAKDLIYQLTEEQNKELQHEGINTHDIIDIMYLPSTQNTFHKQEKKTLNKHIIEFKPLAKGGDLGWMFGFHKKLVNENVGLSPNERVFYLAAKVLFEPEELNESEKTEIFGDKELMKESIEFEYLKMKEMCETLNNDEAQKIKSFKLSHINNRKDKLDTYLKQAGSSLRKLSQENIEQASMMLDKTLRFKERRLNVMGEFPIYIDIDSFLHIYLRHVEEFKVNQHFEHKDNFQFSEDDIFLVMNNIIKVIEDEYQVFRKNNPSTRFSKYGKQSMYFQGDYYTFHIEPNGRISTFHKNRKNEIIA